jgi:hypothetical protein
MDYHFVSPDFVYHPAGLEEDLPVPGFNFKWKLSGPRTSMGHGRNAFGGLPELIEDVVRFLD